MLDSLFVALIVISFAITYISLKEKSVIFSMLGIIIWLINMGQSLLITDGCTNYSEYGFSAFCLLFVFVHIFLLIMCYTEWRDEGEMP